MTTAFDADEISSIAACAERVLEQAGVPRPRRLEPITGGGNNRVYRVETAAGPALLKVYFRHAADPRDRLNAEFGFSSFAWDLGARALPRPLASDHDAGMAVYEFVAGTKLAAREVTGGHVAEAAAFFRDLDRHRLAASAAALPTASEACFSIADHLACIDARVGRLLSMDPDTPLGRRAHELITGRLVPAWQAIREAVHAAAPDATSPLPPADRCVSPSDFGFHNAIVAVADGRLRFVDFEYAGHDDPAKLVCDFFCQPAVPVPREHLSSFLQQAFPDAARRDAVSRRAALLQPAYEIKWCCIMLNEFLPAADSRRTFAGAVADLESRRAVQLTKVAAALDRLEA